MKAWFAASELTGLPGLPESVQRINRRAKAEQWRTRPRMGRGGGNEFSVIALPKETREALERREINKPVALSPEKLAELQAHADQIERRSRKKIQRPSKPEPRVFTEEEKADLWVLYEGRSKTAKKTALQKIKCVQTYYALIIDGYSKVEAMPILSERFGFSERSIFRMLHAIRGQHPTIWAPLLVGKQIGSSTYAEFSAQAWGYILEEYLSLSEPSLGSVMKRARIEAKKHGWIIPCNETVRRRIAKLDRRVVIKARKGERALRDTYMPQTRDYSGLGVHELWEADGHKVDVFCITPDGRIVRPVVYVWRDVRTRRVLGWTFDETENTELVRKSFHYAASRCRGFPEFVLIDNGRAGASKEISGGQKTRFRWTIQEDETDGLLTMLGITIEWAEPYSGQSKPIERFFLDYADNVDKRFPGAYCGNKPEARPENCDPANAIPIAEYIELAESWFVQFNTQAHSGDAMDGRSPVAVYDELIAEATVRTPTETQLRLCLMSAESVRLQGKRQSIRIMGNVYWCEELAALSCKGPYTARYNPDDAAEPIHLYDGEKLICAVPLHEKTGFRDKTAAKAHSRNRNAYIRETKKADEALRRSIELRHGWSETSHDPDAETFDVPGIKRLVQPKRQKPLGGKAKQHSNPREADHVDAAIDRQLRKIEAFGR